MAFAVSCFLASCTFLIESETTSCQIRWYKKFKTVWYDAETEFEGTASCTCPKCREKFEQEITIEGSSASYNADSGGSKILSEMFGKPISQIFSNPKSIFAVHDFLFTAVGNNQKPEQANAYVLDYFGGSGTTAHATMLLNNNPQTRGNRKFILVEQGPYFESVILPRVKKAAFSVGPRSWKSGKPKQDEQEGIGIFVKYYKLEQYEDVLVKSSIYTEDKPPEWSNPEDYTKYLFMNDPNLIDPSKIKIDYDNNKYSIDYKNIYPNIDLAETLSCVRGEMIKKQEKAKVTFDSGEIDYKEIEFNDVKDLLWWYEV